MYRLDEHELLARQSFRHPDPMIWGRMSDIERQHYQWAVQACIAYDRFDDLYPPDVHADVTERARQQADIAASRDILIQLCHKLSRIPEDTFAEELGKPAGERIKHLIQGWRNQASLRRAS